MMIDGLATTVFEGTGFMPWRRVATNEAQPHIESKRHTQYVLDTGRGLRRMAGWIFEKKSNGRGENYAALLAGLRRQARQLRIALAVEESVDGQLVAGVGRRRRANERVVAAPAHCGGARMHGVLETRRRFPRDVAGAQHSGHHDERKGNFFEDLKTGRHGNLFL
ncbi:hypothetical protein [Burkholderia sp. Ac-20365]|uniref:hypothetical protein n=1 Tax=Burkholderia sp. Ac-20365 TaxID=2703897 RepID=UPI00197C17A1|nr:hypothetical protein [Burkholderia sp. Ac-20365]